MANLKSNSVAMVVYALELACSGAGSRSSLSELGVKTVRQGRNKLQKDSSVMWISIFTELMSCNKNIYSKRNALRDLNQLINENASHNAFHTQDATPGGDYMIR